MVAPVTPLIGCDTFVCNARQQVLLIQRADNGFWALPGGFHDLHETPAECAAREFLEETGLQIRITQLLGVFSSNRYEEKNYPHKGGKYVHIVFRGELIDPTAQPTRTSESSAVNWFDERNLPPLSDGHDVRIACAFAALRNPSVAAHFE